MYFVTDWTERVDYDTIRAERLARTQQLLADEHLDAALVFKIEHARYISGLRPIYMPNTHLRHAALVARGNPDVIAFPSGGDWDHRRQTMYWLNPENVRALPPLEDAALIALGMKVIGRALADLGVTGGRVGLDLITLPALRALERSFPQVEWVDCDDAFKRVKWIKTAEEVKALRIACACVDLAFDRAVRASQVGKRECEILGDIMQTLYYHSMETPQCSLIVSSGDNLSPFCRFASDRVVQHGDLVLVDAGGCFNGMFAEGARTFSVGKPNRQQQAIYRGVYEAMQAIVGALRPGNTSADVHRAASDAYNRSGYGEYALATVLGHSIGISCWEPPTLGDPAITGDVFPLEPGMFFSLEPTIVAPGVPGGGTVRIEDEILITETGCEVMTHAALDENLLDWTRPIP